MKKSNDMKTQLLEAAEYLVQTRGYHAFSYKDLSLALGIKTSSIHYYFPTKSDLGKNLVIWSIEKTTVLLNQLRKEKSFHKQLLNYIDAIMASTYQDAAKMCLGGMLATDILTLDVSIRNELKRFFNLHERWIEETLKLGRKASEFSFEGSASQKARSVMSLIEGALILIRLYEEDKRIKELPQVIMELVQ